MKILIIRFSSIGDIVMMTPVIRILKTQIGAEVHFLTKSVFRDIIEYNPHLSKVHTLEDEEILNVLKKEKYDFCADLHNNLRSHKFTRALGVKSKRINKLTIKKFLKIYTPIDVLPRDLHVAHRAINTVKHLNVVDDYQGMEVFFPKGYQYSIPVVKPYFTLALATAKKTKNIPEDQLVQIILSTDKTILLLGGKADAELGQRLSLLRENVINMAGASSILESMYMVSCSIGFIGGDTGLLHIACALKIPTISVWGATIPEYGVFPYYGKSEIPHTLHEVELNCRPCSKHGTQSCPQGHFNCMKKQSMSSIFASIATLE